MPIHLIPLNGKSPYIDYNEFESALKLFLGTTCNEATLYIYNNFLTPVSSETKIDILILLSIHDKSGNYTRHRNTNGRFDYFRNTIVPITVNSTFLNSNILIKDNYLEIDEYEYENSDALNSLKFGFLNFLEKKIGCTRNKLLIEPIELILNKNQSMVFGTKLIGNALSGNHFFQLLMNDPSHFFQSYQPWKGDNGYEFFKNEAAKINEIAATFTEFGFLTKRKLERVEKQLIGDSAMYDAIGQQPTLISGKAGTGKTAHLLHLLIRSLTENRNVSFLTYNHLLTKEIATYVSLIKNNLYSKWEKEGKDVSRFANATVETLMGFMFRLSKKLGVLHLMTEKRMTELKEVLDRSLDILKVQLPDLFSLNSQKIFGANVNWNSAIEAIQNSKLDISSKHYGIDLVRFLRKNNKSLTVGLALSIAEFKNIKLVQLEEMTHKNVFLRDYIGCLKNTINIIRDTDKFYEDFDVKNKFLLLDALMNLSTRKQDEDLKNGKISLQAFTTRIKNVIKGRTSKARILMVDEGQDCHFLEREIFYDIFSPENIVASFGGQEQLIRFSETCNWGIYNGKVINIRKIGSGNKSYRLKKHILDFCNFIADHHNIDFKLQSFSEEDTGELIFDFRPTTTTSLGQQFSYFLEKGAVNNCKPIESLLILDVNNRETKVELGDGNHFVYREVRQATESVVNEFDVMEDRTVAEYKEFDYLKELSNYSQYWVGAVADKQKIGFPYPNEVRIINYESCRGLEAWSVMCLSIDKFYNYHKESEEAEKFLLNENIFLTKDQRAAMYAITWVLMAATRGIDTLYMQMSDLNNEFVGLCKIYAEANQDKCRIYKD
jgi:hypothetical protein